MNKPDRPKETLSSYHVHSYHMAVGLALRVSRKSIYLDGTNQGNHLAIGGRMHYLIGKFERRNRVCLARS